MHFFMLNCIFCHVKMKVIWVILDLPGERSAWKGLAGGFVASGFDLDFTLASLCLSGGWVVFLVGMEVHRRFDDRAGLFGSPGNLLNIYIYIYNIP